jgi:hypothetical protein
LWIAEDFRCDEDLHRRGGNAGVIALPAHASGWQAASGRRKKGGAEEPEVDEKAYKGALERIPDSKEKCDPWGMTRPAEPAKKPK